MIETQFSQLEVNEYYEDKKGLKEGWRLFAQKIIKIRDKKSYRIEYSTFEDFCQQELGIGKAYAYQLTGAAEVIQNLEKSAIADKLPSTESQTRPLTRLEPELQPLVWAEVVEINDNITAKKVEEKVQEYEQLNEALKDEKKVEVNIFNPNPENKELSNRLNKIAELSISEQIAEVKKIASEFKKPHVSNNSGENEWYTPAVFIEKARKVLGKIDLDPASCEKANETVKASKYYSQEDDGLSQPWYGNVWLNPPYAQPLIKYFSEKVRDEDFTSGIVLVNNATETEWFRNIFIRCSAVCFPAGRIKFIDQYGNPSGAPLQGQAIFYIGNEVAKFKAEFSDCGIVVVPA